MQEIILSFQLILLTLFSAFYIIGLQNSCAYELHPMDVVNGDGSDQYGIMNSSKAILWKVRLFCVTRFGDFWAKPLITCSTCMASFHGTKTFVDKSIEQQYVFHK